MFQMVRRWRGTIKQPFAIKLFSGVWNAHPRFATRTILVKNNDVDSAFSLLNRLMDSEGLLKLIRRTQFYHKPTQQRKQLSIEASNAIFNEDMTRKMQFLLRKNRPDAHPGQMTT
ncbi:Mitochondrial Ribosomal Protein Small [Trichostrongylus colubriformis]|uniref:Mitochondrial Ribosomal Protein Small n=1 Tax=Trichostrongylus colubriformis TaxID=6319 RepID=A0AAN8IRM7_TRICO